jgi:diguanylate cyclase (GGDEF)-like protein
MSHDIASPMHFPSTAESAFLLGRIDIEKQPLTLDPKYIWRLAATSFAEVKKLQSELDNARQDIRAKQSRITELENLVTTDELTGLTNRRGFYDFAEKELDRVNRGQSKGGVIVMIDLDNFKQINDTHGHHAGDAALQLIAQCLSSYIRKMDMAARLGGDEFAVILSDTCKDICLDRVQKLARKLNRLILKYNGYRIPVRASLGVQNYAKGNRLETILGQADAKMYEAKEAKQS